MIYEFACDKCFKRGVVTTWEAEFKLDEPKVSFCHKCGGEGKQVILTAPMLGSAKAKDYKAADKMLEEAHRAQTGRDPGSKVESLKEDPELLRAIGMKSTKAHWGTPQDALSRAQGTQAMAQQHAADPHTEVQFSKPEASVIHISKDDQASRAKILSEAQ